jgi:methionyl-tRNA formyltransferase
MRLLFAGTPGLALPTLQALSARHQIVAVLTRPPAAQGRRAALVASPVAQWAQAHQVPVLAPRRVSQAGLADQVRALAPDCCPVVAYGGLITAELLAIPAGGWVNLHFSTLPAYRGAAPVQAALLDGCTRTGVTTFRLVAELDAGPVYRQVTVDIADEETAGDLLERLASLGASVMVDTLADIAAGGSARDQPTAGVSYAAKISTDQARLDLSGTVAQLVNRVRAMSPRPGAWCQWQGQVFKVLRARRCDHPGPDPTGRAWLVGALRASRRALWCRVGDGWVELVEVQPAGKKPMAGADWARGALGEAGRLA